MLSKIPSVRNEGKNTLWTENFRIFSLSERANLAKTKRPKIKTAVRPKRTKGLPIPLRGMKNANPATKKLIAKRLNPGLKKETIELVIPRKTKVSPIRRKVFSPSKVTTRSRLALANPCPKARERAALAAKSPISKRINFRFLFIAFCT